jgi:hypothetical protein
VLYPALVRALGPGQPGLEAVAHEHARLHERSAAIVAGRFTGNDVADYARLAREHFEHEIHGLFVLAEEWIDDAELERMANWSVDHTLEALGRPTPWEKD